MELEKCRQEYRLLKLFTNRQVMIIIILLTTSTTQNKIKHYFLEKLFSAKDITDNDKNEKKLSAQGLIHYLQSLRLNNCDLSRTNLSRLYRLYKIDSLDNDSVFLKKLCQFLHDLFNDGKELFPINDVLNESQQYLITLNSSTETTDQTPFDHDLDINTCCILLHIFKNRLPSCYQILWCSISTEPDIRLFFSRVRTFHSLTFVVMDIDKMHHRLREQLLNEQNLLAQQQEPHGPVYYFSRELTASQKGLRPFNLPQKSPEPSKICAQLLKLFQQNNNNQPEIEIIYGKAGVGQCFMQ